MDAAICRRRRAGPAVLVGGERPQAPAAKRGSASANGGSALCRSAPASAGCPRRGRSKDWSRLARCRWKRWRDPGGRRVRLRLQANGADSIVLIAPEGAAIAGLGIPGQVRAIDAKGTRALQPQLHWPVVRRPGGRAAGRAAAREATGDGHALGAARRRRAAGGRAARERPAAISAGFDDHHRAHPDLMRAKKRARPCGRALFFFTLRRIPYSAVLPCLGAAASADFLGGRGSRRSAIRADLPVRPRR